MQIPQLSIAYYGDDFTGSTDALEFLSRAGLQTMLFFEVPTKETLEQYTHLQAIGIAGRTRALGKEAMKEELETAFDALAKLQTKHVHYKVCSTFDSSPEIGNIGLVLELGLAQFKNQWTPILVAAPSLGRYAVFGNLFARMGIGSDGQIYRLDRHPSMSKHPVTPADEADLRLHLGRQTSVEIGLLDILQVEANNLAKAHTEQVSAGKKALFIDATNEDHLLTIGEFLEEKAQDQPHILFSIGSSGIEMALGSYWNQQGVFLPKNTWQPLIKVDALLVISGSCSPVTSAQIDWAKQHDFIEIIIDAPLITQEELSENILQSYINQAISYIENGKSVMIHTQGGSQESIPLSSEKLGTALGLIAKKVIESTHLTRLLIAGGDTSSYAARALEIEALEMIAPVVKGAPLCQVYSNNEAINGLEVNVKGGQVGAANYFGLVRGDLA
ncbi:four-carbon acid sugar kinase family protein [Flectobacillus sp. DC10W]|uniref:Four-carbon acid sugar kinase family protein n=1 Tax=Flectobacillus longus TaxID=2984207 RepID=A0ABT6YQC3_9BACT|nr:four-carbon acid sugar kinase family protein [Flectobacillus longus]MDI9865659.1 four-carbon acid sugar kinase family protein [Flectobacillus longus]